MYLNNFEHKRREINKNQVSFALLNSINRDKDEDLNPVTLSIGGAMRISGLVSQLKNKVRKNSSSLQRDSSSSTLKKQFSSHPLTTGPAVPSQLTDPNPTYPALFFRNAFTHEHRPLLVRPQTAISRAHSNDFPSPRIGMSNTTAKNYEILPYPGEDAQGLRIDSEEYDRIHFKGIYMLRKSRRT